MRMTVCLDPGHGVQTAGKRSPDGGYLEHEFALDMSRRIAAYLERVGVNVIVTRADENDVSLDKRCSIANDAKADWFISLHSNASGSGWSSARGRTVYIVAAGGRAEKLAKRLDSQLGGISRGVKTADFKVLRDTSMPAVLIEYAFHTNVSDVALLSSDDWREDQAALTAKAILEEAQIMSADMIIRDWSGGRVWPAWNGSAVAHSEWYKREGADEAVNLCHFELATGKTVQYIRYGNSNRAYGGSAECIGFKNGKAHAYPSAEALIADGCTDGFSGMPCLIWNGAATGQSANVGMDTVRSRTAVGLKDDSVVVIQSAGATAAQMTAAGLNYGVDTLLLMDGGGSTMHMSGAGVDYRPEGARNVPSVLCFESKKSGVFETFINGSKRTDVFETSDCKKKIGSLDPGERCTLLFRGDGFAVVMYFITGSSRRKVGFIKV